ncbi:MAG: ribosome biogenesis GTP-binding protein YihA/YsxC [Rikenellaceae bacterium]
MLISKAEFKCSSEKVSQVPADSLHDFAFIGRSNVGKSSLINMLTNNSSLAKTSSTPGKTQLINHFKINNEWYLVDLPGYGYARASKSKRLAFEKIITNYVTKCEKMYMLFVLVDSRLEPQKIDLNFMEMLAENGIPFGIIFTKVDKLNATQRKKNIEKYKNILLESWEELPPTFITSSEKRVGGEEILQFIDACLKDIAQAEQNES